MPSTVSVSHVAGLTVTQTFTGDQIDPGNTNITVSGLNVLGTFDADTSVPVTKQANFTKALSSGTGTIDLTALPGITADETVTFDTLRVQFLIFTNPSTNANAITIAQGGSNAWTGLGTTFSFTLQPGQSTGPWYLDEDGPNVSSTVKNIALTGTAAQELRCLLVAG